MMTIKQFASLCGCNAQTLRYYDRIGLLKPVSVDPWTGYRYYGRAQAVDFVKIKNLQDADFTIAQIKELLSLPDELVYEAFDRKIAEQTQKLERIQTIQQSYLTEVTKMKHLIESFCGQLLERANDHELLKEFGMSPEDAATLVETIRSRMLTETARSGEEARTVRIVVDEEAFGGPEAVEKLTFLVREDELDSTVYLNAENIKQDPFEPTEDLEPVWSAQGWDSIRDILDRVPKLDEHRSYTVLVHLHDKPMGNTISYPLLLIGALLLRGYGPETNLSCFVEASTDGQNHFTLYRKR